MEWLWVIGLLVILGLPTVVFYSCICINPIEDECVQSEILTDLEQETVDKVLSALQEKDIEQKEN